MAKPEKFFYVIEWTADTAWTSAESEVHIEDVLSLLAEQSNGEVPVYLKDSPDMDYTYISNVPIRQKRIDRWHKETLS